VSVRFNRRVVRELYRLESVGLIDVKQVWVIAERYPTTDWDVALLVRCFTILGAIAAGAGAILLASQAMNVLRLLETCLALATGGLIASARWLAREKDMPRTAAAMEMTAGFALQGLTTALAIDFSTGSRNWPALVGVQTVLLIGLAYALSNRLVLAHACVTAFVWFGGETGYVSGWGMYWLGMTYPMRFLAIGALTLGIAWVHATYIPRYQPFTRVYAHFGALVVHLALWFLSVFGSFAGRPSWPGSDGERLGFTMLWAAVAVGCLLAGGRWGLAWLRGYGLTFLIINVYTFYFQFVVVHSAELWWIHLLFSGGTLLALGFWLERYLRGDARAAPL